LCKRLITTIDPGIVDHLELWHERALRRGSCGLVS
jgi:hypothetical protein